MTPAVAPPGAHVALEEVAHAKVNLFLRVTGRRADGYHLLDSLVVFAGAADMVSVVPDHRLSLALSGPFAAGLPAPGAAEGDDNLVLRAARALAAVAADQGRREFAGGRLVLDKHLPVASGIGGGSADAAATLRLMRRFWSLDAVDDARLHELASGLGADVPVCLRQRPAVMRGVGEILHEAPALPPALGLLLVNCGQPVATSAIFAARGSGFSAVARLPAGWSDAAALAADLAGLSNDLEAAACRLFPAIGQVLSTLGALPGCRLARMSGSGATCFGLFDTPQAARDALSDARLPGHWWGWAGGLHDPADGSRPDPGIEEPR